MAAEPIAGPAHDFSRDYFEAILQSVDDDDAFKMSHGELEDLLVPKGRELIRRLIQEHLAERARRERRLEVVDAEGVERSRVEEGHEHALSTVVGEVEVTRLAYREPGLPNLHPADGVLNLPAEKYSHGLRKLTAIEIARGSYEAAAEAVERQTGVRIGRRQLEELAIRAAIDFREYYKIRSREPCYLEDVLVLSCDGKGIVMRPEGLREATRKAVAEGGRKLTTRLSKGEKANRKRIAEVGCVYDVEPVPRTPEEILRSAGDEDSVKSAPKAKAKWAMASVTEDAGAVVARVFDEAQRRDPEQRRTWVALVDGNNHQIDLIRSQARKRGVTVHIVCDFVHALEYLWKAAWLFHDEGDPEAETWVHDKALAVLQGESSRVAGAIRRMATRRGLESKQRKTADACADYLLRKRPYLNYPVALANGWPVATGVIEGAVRYLVKDRMDLTGARWGLEGAEAVLKLRALRANDDFEDYWRHHLAFEKRRVHQSRYLGNSIPGDTPVP